MSKQTRRTDAALMGATRQATPEDLTSCRADKSRGTAETAILKYIEHGKRLCRALCLAAVWPYLEEFSVHDCQ